MSFDNESIVKLASLNLALNSAEGILLRNPAELEIVTTLEFCFSNGNNDSQTLKVPK